MTLLQGNNMDLLRDLPDNSVHSVGEKVGLRRADR
jgi:hypothetical protein